MSLDTLPKELIAHIATYVDATTALSLSLTCRTIRAASYDALVFKQILETSQSCYWMSDDMDFEAVSQRCRGDVAAWARYSIADQKALQLSQSRDVSTEATEHSLHWLPELMVVRHPFMRDDFWRIPSTWRLHRHPKYTFALAVALLAVEQPIQHLICTISMFNAAHRLIPKPQQTDHMLVLCWTLPNLKRLITCRLAAWPYNDSALVPYITTPSVSDIALWSEPTYTLPVPYSPAAEDWTEWQSQHIQILAARIASRPWQGYYTDDSIRTLDPPMTKIEFRRVQKHDVEREESIRLVAEDCHDGLGSFKISGSIVNWDGSSVFSGRKVYDSGSVEWTWDLRLTPFGLVGFWGSGDLHPFEDNNFERHGVVWLWQS